MQGIPISGRVGKTLDEIIEKSFIQRCEVVSRENPYDIDLDVGDNWGERLDELSDKVLGTDTPERFEELVEKVHKAYPSMRVGITNTICCIPWKPVGGGTRGVVKDEAVACRTRLLELLNLAKPKAVVCLGKEAKRFLPKPKEGLSRTLHVVKVDHPRYLMRLRGKDPIKFNEAWKRTILELDRLKQRVWGL